MSFREENFSPIGGQARAGDSPAQWSYRSSVDSLATVLGAGYFNDIATRLQASDYINTELSDTCAILTVETVTLSPGADTVTINPIPYEPGQGNIQEGTVDPIGNITGVGGDLYRRVSERDSSLYVHIGTSSNDTEWVSMKGNDTLLFGAKEIRESAGSVDYLLPGAEFITALSEESKAVYNLPRAGILANLFMRQNVAGVGAPMITYTVRLNGADTALTLEMSPNQGTESNVMDFIPVAAGSTISVASSHTANISTSPQHIHASMSFF